MKEEYDDGQIRSNKEIFYEVPICKNCKNQKAIYVSDEGKDGLTYCQKCQKMTIVKLIKTMRVDIK